MNKAKKIFLIVLLIASLVGGAGILAGFLMGAQPLQIGNALLRQVAEKCNADVYAGVQNMLNMIPAVG